MGNKTITVGSFLLGTLIEIAVGVALVLIFPMHPEKVQGWFAGLLQGIFWFYNWVVSWFRDIWYVHAPLCGKGYNFWFWFGVVGWAIVMIWGTLSMIIRVRTQE
jgi:hypothetical protein